jgi:hypothetical protein
LRQLSVLLEIRATINMLGKALWHQQDRKMYWLDHTGLACPVVIIVVSVIIIQATFVHKGGRSSLSSSAVASSSSSWENSGEPIVPRQNDFGEGHGTQGLRERTLTSIENQLGVIVIATG